MRLGGGSVEEALALAGERGEETGAAFVHPFDDLDVIAGQGTLGLELLRTSPTWRVCSCPSAAAGWQSGIGIALRHARADVELVGVQARACAPYVKALSGRGSTVEVTGAREATVAPGATIADGIAITRPGRLTLPLLRELLRRPGDGERG